MDITGTWKITGWNAGREKTGEPDYKGIVEVAQTHAAGSYSLQWTVGAAQSKQPGIAVYDAEGGVLAASYVMGSMPGVVLYRPDASGTGLEGRWNLGASLHQAPGFEDWSR